jgi:hypothetical protein
VTASIASAKVRASMSFAVGLRGEGCAGDVECLGDELGFTAGK